VVSQISKSASMIDEVIAHIEATVLVQDTDFRGYDHNTGHTPRSPRQLLEEHHHVVMSGPHDALLCACVCRPNGEVRPMEVLEFYDLIESKRMARLEQLVQKQKSIESPLIKVRPCQTSLEDSSHQLWSSPQRDGRPHLSSALLCLVRWRSWWLGATVGAAPCWPGTTSSGRRRCTTPSPR
jgi:hypothetical protein